MYLMWISKTAPIVEDLIKEGLVAFRETLGYHDAIMELDQVGKRSKSPGFWTNLCLQDHQLEEKQVRSVKALTLIAQLYNENEVIPSKSKVETRAISPDLLWPEGSPRRGLTEKLIKEIGLTSIKESEISDKTRLAIISPQHNQALVDFWSKYIRQVEFVVVLLGTSFEHIRTDLGLPSERYMPLVSVDVLNAVDKERRSVMIPEWKRR